MNKTCEKPTTKIMNYFFSRRLMLRKCNQLVRVFGIFFFFIRSFIILVKGKRLYSTLFVYSDVHKRTSERASKQAGRYATTHNRWEKKILQQKNKRKKKKKKNNSAFVQMLVVIIWYHGPIYEYKSTWIVSLIFYRTFFPITIKCYRHERCLIFL